MTRRYHGEASRSRRTAAIGLSAAIGLILAACGGAATSSASSTAMPSGSGALGPRPSSPAVVTILEPKPNQTVSGDMVHVVLDLKNATIVKQTTTNLKPDEGHVHLYVDNVLVSMNYGLTQDVPVHAGTYALKAEFVASDHAPFSPRVWSPVVVFTVK
jgi:hypothetical protein